ncbi:LysR family transcriptional regulator [Leifsonia sp. Leaf336]|uniref:LysR family transcriptional regulator n=1 Tax=Leifsonia sp. Leaf336 TaxID=1736341 RepID=UPI00138F3935|nr:LysR family transcriptional regulator [Leifsonia sp. Leaf336]
MKPPPAFRAGSYTLRQVECFVAVADAGSIASAARLLHLSESAVAEALGSFEGAFATTLLVRQRARGIELTSDGIAVLASARDLLRQSERLSAVLGPEAGQASGVVRVGAVQALAPSVLPLLLVVMQREFPAVEVRYTIADQHELVDALREGRLDAVLAFDIDVSHELPSYTLDRTQATVVVHDGHPLALREVVELRELSDEPMVLLDIDTARTHTLELMGRAGVRPRIAHRAIDVELCRAMVGQGLGYSILMSDSDPQLTWDGNRVRHLRIAPESPVIDIKLVWRDADPNTAVSLLLRVADEVRRGVEAAP